MGSLIIKKSSAQIISKETEHESKYIVKTIATLGDGTNKKIIKQFLKEIKMVRKMMPFGY